jgi:hypothetical protein
VFEHFNALTFPYIQMAKLPLRYQIISTGTATNSMRAFCGTVISEGGFSPLGQIFSYGNFTSTGVTGSNSVGVLVPIMGIRLKASNPANRATLKLKNLDVFSSTTAAAGAWQILLNPVISGATPPSWTEYSTIGGPRAAQSSVEVKQYGDYVAGTTVTGGHILYSGFYAQRANETIYQSTDELIAAYAAGTNIAGTVADELILVANVVISAGSAPQLFGMLQWIEFL